MMLPVILLVAAVVRLAAVFAYGAHVRPDVSEFEVIANNLLAGRGFLYEDVLTYCEPLYVFLTYAVYAITGHSFLAMALVHVALSVALVALAYVIAHAVGGPAAAVWTAALVALDPGLVRYAVKFHSLVLDALLFALLVALMLRARTSPRVPTYAALGVALGLCVLARPTVLAFVPLAFAWMLVADAVTVRRRLALACVAFVVAAAVVTPWVARNYGIHHRLVLTRTSAAYPFWLGNNPQWTGSGLDAHGNDLFLAMPPALRARLDAADELGRSDIYLAESLAIVRAAPLAVVGRAAVKFVHFWWSSPQLGLLYQGEPMWIYRLFYAAVLPWALLGVCRLGVEVKRRSGGWWAAGLVLLFLLTLSLAQSIFYVEGRHRLSVEALLLILTGVGIVTSLSWLGARATFARSARAIP